MEKGFCKLWPIQVIRQYQGGIKVKSLLAGMLTKVSCGLKQRFSEQDGMKAGSTGIPEEQGHVRNAYSSRAPDLMD